MAEPRIAIDILVNCQSATSQLKNFNKELNKTVEGGKKASNWLSKGLTRFIGAFVGFQTIKGLVNTGSRIQLVQKSIEGLTKSTQDWNYIQQQAFKTGTEIEVVAKGYRNFYSSAKMAGFGRGTIQTMYGDILLSTRAIGASTQQTEGALLALEQMISKGTVSMEELRRQLGNAIPGAFEIGAKAMNMTTKEFNEFVKTGKLASTVFVPRFIKTLKEAYADGFKEIEQTVSVAQIRLSNSWKLLQADIMSGETGKSFASALNTLRETLDSPEFRQFIVYVGQLAMILVNLFNFLIKNMRLVLILLGVGGFYGWLAKTHSIFKLFTMNIGKALIVIRRFGGVGKFAFAGLTAGAKAFMATLFRVLIPLLLIEDVILGLGQRFLGWNVKSLTGDLLVAQKELSDTKKATVVDSLNLPENVKKDPKFKKYRDIINSGGTLSPETWQQLNMGVLPMQISAPSSPNLEKTDNTTQNISMGDININIDGANDTIAVGNAVKEILLGLFKGENLMLNTESAVV